MRNSDIRITSIIAKSSFAVGLAMLSLLLVIPQIRAEDQPTLRQTETHIRTDLHRGWNLVGWLGPPITSEQIFRQVPHATRLGRWDPALQDYYSFQRRGPATQDYTFPGQAIWLYLAESAPSPFVWERPKTFLQETVPITTGLNQVAWSGTAADMNASLPLSDMPLGVLRWNARQQSWIIYAANSAADASLGDGILIYSHSETVWRQPVEVGVEIVVLGELPADMASAFEDERDRVEHWLDNQFAVPVPYFRIAVSTERESLAEFRQDPSLATDRSACSSWKAGRFDQVIVANDECKCGDAEAARVQTAGTIIGWLVLHHHNSMSPEWHQRFGAPIWFWGSVSQRLSSAYADINDPGSVRSHQFKLPTAASHATTITATLAEHHDATYTNTPRLGSFHRSLGYLSAHWLVQQAGLASLMRYATEYMLHETWEDALQSIFGVAVQEFYDGVERYRHTIGAQPLTAGESRIIAIVGDVEQFFENKEGVAGGWVPWLIDPSYPSYCTGGNEINITSFCLTDYGVYAHEYAHALQWRLMEGSTHAEPGWLVEGHADYEEALYNHSRDLLSYEQARAGWSQESALTNRTLSDPLLGTDVPWVYYPLGALAMEWLSHYIGGESLMDFWRARATIGDWQVAFREFFGISLDDFYTEFETWRKAGFPRIG